jgi:prophage tail gpP-like protein
MADDDIPATAEELPNRAPVQITVNKPAPDKEADDTPKYERMAGPKDVATLEVRGEFFHNWTSVRVEQRWTEAFPTFSFECTEETPVPLSIKGAQFVPGDVVRVLLGGAPAVFGYITERHVAYDKNTHGIRLIGCGDTADLVNSSVPLKALSGHDGKSVYQLAKDLTAHLGINILTRGAVDHQPFENIGVLPGETPIQAIERYAKMRQILIGSEANGGLLLIGDHPSTTRGWLVEGINILRANCVLRDGHVYKRIFAVGQNVSGDKGNGDPQNKQVAEREGTSSRAKEIVVVADVADTQHGIERRADMEYAFTQGGELEAQITVQGWFKDANQSEDIWRAGEYYTVTSPSLILYDMVLGCAGCVYEQTEGGGTTTTLQMVLPVHMLGRDNFRAGELIARKKRLEELKSNTITSTGEL